MNLKDSFTRICQERDAERVERLEPLARKAKEERKRNEEHERIRTELFSLFGETNPHRRGKAMELVLNKVFLFHRIVVTEAIAIKADSSDVIEQINGVIQLRGKLFLLEMKWESETLGRAKEASHLVRVFNRRLA